MAMRVVALLLLLIVALAVKETGLYDELGVSPSASASEIKRAYRKMSLKHHPDRNPDDAEAHERFMKISSAYEVLSDEEKKSIYDRYGQQGLTDHETQARSGGGGGGGFGGDPFDIFNSFFGGRGGSRDPRERRGEDVHIPLVLSLDQVYNGFWTSIEVQNRVLCSSCGGTGAKSHKHIHTCKACGGHGVKMQRVQLGPGMFQQFQSTCDVCGGTGKVIKEKCPVCQGHKVEQGKRELDLFVERGTPNGHQIVFENAADESPDHAAGHLVYTVETLPHARFQRHEAPNHADLSMTLNITLLEALVGFDRTIEHMDGHAFSVSSSGVTHPNQIISVRGEGMPRVEDITRKGDLFVKIAVDFPQQVTPQQQEGFRSLLSVS